MDNPFTAKSIPESILGRTAQFQGVTGVWKRSGDRFAFIPSAGRRTVRPTVPLAAAPVPPRTVRPTVPQQAPAPQPPTAQQTPTSFEQVGDLNKDGKMDFNDFIIFAANQNKQVQPIVAPAARGAGRGGRPGGGGGGGGGGGAGGGVGNKKKGTKLKFK